MAAEASVAAKQLKKACSSSNQERAQLALRRCRSCGGTRHNARTCKKDAEEDSASDASTRLIDSLFNSDKNRD